MARIERFEDVEGWKKGRELRRAVNRAGKRGEFAKGFSLKDQIGRAAQPVTSNVAKGFERGGNRQFIHFLSDATGSRREVRGQLYTALDEAYASQTELDELYELSPDTSRLISDLRGSKYKRGPEAQ